MKYSLFLFFLMSFSVSAESVLDQVLNNTQDEQIALREEKIKGLTGVSLKDIATRTQLEHEIKVLKQEKGRRVLQQAIENTDMNQVSSERTAERNRFAPRRTDSGSPLLNSVIDETVAESNPAVRGREIPKERPLVLYRDADPEDIFMAKEIGGAKEKIAVYKSTDLRGRTVYKTVGDRRVVNVIVYEKVFPQEQVIYKDVSGNLKKGYPNAIYSDGTLEIKEQAGTTTRRAPGTYHLSDEVGKINNNQIETHYGKKASPYEDFSQRKDLTENEKRALEKLKRALCNL